MGRVRRPLSGGKEVSNLNTQCFRQASNIHQRNVTLATFHAAHVCPVQHSRICQGFLRNTLLQPDCPQPFAVRLLNVFHRISPARAKRPKPSIDTHCRSVQTISLQTLGYGNVKSSRVCMIEETKGTPYDQRQQSQTREDRCSGDQRVRRWLQGKSEGEPLNSKSEYCSLLCCTATRTNHDSRSDSLDLAGCLAFHLPFEPFVVSVRTPSVPFDLEVFICGCALLRDLLENRRLLT